MISAASLVIRVSGARFVTADGAAASFGLRSETGSLAHRIHRSIVALVADAAEDGQARIPREAQIRDRSLA
jgi:hypothetical protein